FKADAADLVRWAAISCRKEGAAKLAKMATTATVTISSMSVKPRCRRASGVGLPMDAWAGRALMSIAPVAGRVGGGLGAGVADCHRLLARSRLTVDWRRRGGEAAAVGRGACD